MIKRIRKLQRITPTIFSDKIPGTDCNVESSAYVLMGSPLCCVQPPPPPAIQCQGFCSQPSPVAITLVSACCAPCLKMLFLTLQSSYKTGCRPHPVINRLTHTPSECDGHISSDKTSGVSIDITLSSSKRGKVPSFFRSF